MTTLKPQDEGKPLVTPRGDIVGVLDRMDGETAYVRPNEDLLAGYGSWIGGSIHDVESFRLDEGSIAKIASDRIVLGGNDVERSSGNSVQ